MRDVVGASVLNIAHRGFSSRCPENTLSAFRAAMQAGADLCELDVRLSRDRVAVVIHDETVERTTNGRGRVADLTVKEIKRLDAGVKFGPSFAGERVPILEEVIELTQNVCGLNVELKESGVEQEVSRIARCRPGNLMASSFQWDLLERLRELAPELRVGLLADEKPERLLATAISMGAFAIHPRFTLAGPALCAEAHRQGLKVYVWTVAVPAEMRRLIANGVDGIMTNFPERLSVVLREAELR